MAAPLGYRRPPCPVPASIPCRFRLYGRCCHAGFEDRCPLPSLTIASLPVVHHPEGQDTPGLGSGACADDTPVGEPDLDAAWRG